MSSHVTFGKNLRKARMAANLTQKQVAQKAGLHVNFYARVERGEENPSYASLEKIIKSLGVKSGEVFPF
jgi:transcriptional regulator with XRE-family HTH domain